VRVSRHGLHTGTQASAETPARPCGLRSSVSIHPLADQLATKGPMQGGNFVAHWCELPGKLTQAALGLRLRRSPLTKRPAAPVSLVRGGCSRNRYQRDDPPNDEQPLHSDPPLICRFKPGMRGQLPALSTTPLACATDGAPWQRTPYGSSRSRTGSERPRRCSWWGLGAPALPRRQVMSRKGTPGCHALHSPGRL
jgi:hypothetical protein